MRLTQKHLFEGYFLFLKDISARWIIFCLLGLVLGVCLCVVPLQHTASVRLHPRNLICLQSDSIPVCLFILPCRLTSSISADGTLISTQCVCVFVNARPGETLAQYHLQLEPGDLSKAKNNLPPGNC